MHSYANFLPQNCPNLIQSKISLRILQSKPCPTIAHAPCPFTPSLTSDEVKIAPNQIHRYTNFILPTEIKFVTTKAQKFKHANSFASFSLTLQNKKYGPTEKLGMHSTSNPGGRKEKEKGKGAKHIACSPPQKLTRSTTEENSPRPTKAERRTGQRQTHHTM
jgi:hypothetical protein